MPKPTVKLVPEVVARCRRAVALLRDGYSVNIAVKRARTSTNALYAFAEREGFQVRDLSKSLAFKKQMQH